MIRRLSQLMDFLHHKSKRKLLDNKNSKQQEVQWKWVSCILCQIWIHSEMHLWLNKASKKLKSKRSTKNQLFQGSQMISSIQRIILKLIFLIRKSLEALFNSMNHMASIQAESIMRACLTNKQWCMQQVSHIKYSILSQRIRRSSFLVTEVALALLQCILKRLTLQSLKREITRISMCTSILLWDSSESWD